MHSDAARIRQLVTRAYIYATTRSATRSRPFASYPLNEFEKYPTIVQRWDPLKLPCNHCIPLSYSAVSVIHVTKRLVWERRARCRWYELILTGPKGIDSEL